MSSKPVVIKLACDSKEAQTNHVRSKLSEILNVYLENMFPEYYPDNRNIGPFKYRTIQISDHSNIGSNYRYFKLIIRLHDDIDYRLSHALIVSYLNN
jgi:hypothetical protein